MASQGAADGNSRLVSSAQSDCLPFPLFRHNILSCVVRKTISRIYISKNFPSKTIMYRDKIVDMCAEVVKKCVCVPEWMCEACGLEGERKNVASASAT